MGNGGKVLPEFKEFNEAQLRFGHLHSRVDRVPYFESTSSDPKYAPEGLSYLYVTLSMGTGILETYKAKNGHAIQKFYPEGTNDLWVRRGTVANMGAWAKVGGGLNRVLLYDADVVFTAGSGSTLVAILETNVSRNYTYEIGIEPISADIAGLSFFIYDWNWGSLTIALDWVLINNQKELRLWKQANSTYSATLHVSVWRVIH